LNRYPESKGFAGEATIPLLPLAKDSIAGAFIISTAQPQQGRKQLLQLSGQQSLVVGKLLSAVSVSVLQVSSEQQVSEGVLKSAAATNGKDIRTTTKVAKIIQVPERNRAAVMGEIIFQN
jgi:hypothetical protein